MRLPRRLDDSVDWSEFAAQVIGFIIGIFWVLFGAHWLWNAVLEASFGIGP